jgi:hypothetical protein
MGLTYSKAESSAPPPVPSFADLTNITAQVCKEVQMNTGNSIG